MFRHPARIFPAIAAALLCTSCSEDPSTHTEIAIVGLSKGAKPMNKEFDT